MLAGFGSVEIQASKFMILVRFYGFEVPTELTASSDRNFKSTALERVIDCDAVTLGRLLDCIGGRIHQASRAVFGGSSTGCSQGSAAGCSQGCAALVRRGTLFDSSSHG